MYEAEQKVKEKARTEEHKFIPEGAQAEQGA
jgi:hypothetical protein